MDRREALKTTSLILGYSLTAGTTAAILHGCKADKATDWSPMILNADEANLLAEICEAILPATDTPGAKDALCDRYIDNVLAMMYSNEDQQYFRDKFKIFNEKAKAKYTRSFIALNSNEKDEVLKLISEEAKEHKKQEHGGKPHIFNAIKELTVAGYCTSEIGAKQFLKYDPIPGPYRGCIEYAEVGGTWALH
jgi:gluconate 2-dehydrogenase gamma chain